MDSATMPAETRELSRARRMWFSGLAVFFALLAGVLLFGWIGLFLGWGDTTDNGIHRVHDVAGSGVGTGLFVATPFLILAWRRDDVALLQAIAVAALSYAIASALATDVAYVFFLPIVLIPVAVLLWVGDGWGAFFRAGRGFAPATFIVSVASAVFWVAFALTMARNQRLGPPTDPHVEMHHWTSMAGMALAILLLGLLASLRARGWRIVVWLAAAGSAVYGLASIVFATFPGTSFPYPGGEGVGWGLLAIVGGIALVAASELDRRRAPSV